MGILQSIFGGKKEKFSQDMDRRLKIDLHSHLIPGLDDGCSTLDDSIRIIDELIDQGVERIITTPHVLEDLYPNSSEQIIEGRDLVRDELSRRGKDVQFDAAAEYYIDEAFVQKYVEGDAEILTFGDKNILVETNYMDRPEILEEVIFELKLQGYSVVLAHPERYRYLLPDFSRFNALRDTGVLFQVNLMSFTGHYSPVVKKAAEYLLKNDLIDTVGSDIHKIQHAELISKFKHSNTYSRLLEKPLINFD